MPIYPIGSIVESQLLVNLEGSTTMVTNFFQVTATPALPNTLATEMRDQYWNIIRGICSNQVKCFGWKSRVVGGTPPTEFVTEVWNDSNGGVISNLQHQGASSIIVVDHEGGLSLRTGRMYPPGSGVGYVNGSFDGSHIARLNTCCNALKARYALGGTLPFFMMLKRTKLVGGYAYFRVTGFRFRNFLGMQRRRRPGVGM